MKHEFFSAKNRQPPNPHNSALFALFKVQGSKRNFPGADLTFLFEEVA